MFVLFEKINMLDNKGIMLLFKLRKMATEQYFSAILSIALKMAIKTCLVVKNVINIVSLLLLLLRSSFLDD